MLWTDIERNKQHAFLSKVFRNDSVQYKITSFEEEEEEEEEEEGIIPFCGSIKTVVRKHENQWAET